MKKERTNNKPKKGSRLGEICRFVIIGCLCTAIDFVVEYLLGLLFADNLSKLGSVVVDGNVVPGYGSYLSLSICVIAGFVISMVVNFFFSRKWVFQDVDKNTNYNTPKYFWSYAGLAFGGLLLGIGIQCLCLWLVNEIWAMNLSLDPFQKVDWSQLFHETSISFWAFFAVFCIKTLIVLVYNYWTRKVFIFKRPKPATVVDNASTSINDQVIVDNYNSEPTNFSEIAPVVNEEKTESKKEEKVGKTVEKSTTKEDVMNNPSIAIKAEDKPRIGMKANGEADTISKIEESDIASISANEAGESKEESGANTHSSKEPDIIYGKPQFKWGKSLTKEGLIKIIYSTLEQYDKRTSSVTNRTKVKEMIVEEILAEEERRKNNVD